MVPPTRHGAARPTTVYILPTDSIAGRCQLLRVADALEAAEARWNQPTSDENTTSRPYLEHLASAVLDELRTTPTNPANDQT